MSIYESLYELISTYIYGGTLDASAQLICTLVSTCGCVFLIAIPFILVWKFITMVVN